MRILVPANFTRSPRQTLGTAIRLASERDAQLVLIHASEAPVDAEHDLALAVQAAIASGIRRVAAELAVGKPDEIAVIVADEIDLVIIERGAAGDDFVRAGSCSVLAIHETPHRPGRHVICGVDGSASADAAAMLAAAALRPDRMTLLWRSAEDLERLVAALCTTSSAAIATRMYTNAIDVALRAELAADPSIDAIAAGAAGIGEPLPDGCSIAIARP